MVWTTVNELSKVKLSIIISLTVLLAGSINGQPSEEATNITEVEPSEEIRNSAIFYEKEGENTVGGDENDYSVTGSYSGLANAMQEANITYNQLRAEITPEILNDYQPNTLIFTNPRNLNEQEIGLIYNWIIRDGGSVYICSEKSGQEDTQSISQNSGQEDLDTLANLLNMDVTSYLLNDDNNYIRPTIEETGNTSNGSFDVSDSDFAQFTVDSDSLYYDGDARELTEDVETVSFHGASGIDVSGDYSRVVIEGNPSTYSKSGTNYLPGSRPPLYVMTEVGRGKAVVAGDCDTFSDTNIGKYDNGRLAKNTFEWLMSKEAEPEKGGEKIYYEISTLSREVSNLQNSLKDVNSTKSELISSKNSLEGQLNQDEEDSGISAFVILLNLVLLGGISGIIYEFRDSLEVPDSLEDALIEDSTSSSSPVSLNTDTEGLEEELGLDQKTQQLEDELDLEEV